MADLESLQELSNNEIRLKCIEYGLPNVPVTDSSRKILLKRLHVAMNEAPTKESVKATTANRRETIAITKIQSNQTAIEKNRRTIDPVMTAQAKEANAAPTAIPISKRRRSVQADQQVKAAKSTASAMETVLIEDDEDDIELMAAVDQAEKTTATTKQPATPTNGADENLRGRRKSRSVSVPKIIENIEIISATAAKRTMTPLAEEKFEELPSTKLVTQTSKVFQSNVEQLRPSQYLRNTTPSVYSTPSSNAAVTSTVGIVGGGQIPSSLSSYRPKYTAENILNEVSDNDDNGCNSPFLSNFARDLERRRSVGRSVAGTTYSPFARRSSYDNHDIRGRSASKADLSIGQIAVALGRKYHAKRIFYLLVLAVVFIYLYLYFYAK